MPKHDDLAEDMAMGGARGAAMGGVMAGVPNGMPGMLGGARSGLISGAMTPLLRRMFPGNPDAAQLIGQGMLMPFPLNLPMMLGGAALLMGGKGDTEFEDEPGHPEDDSEDDE